MTSGDVKISLTLDTLETIEETIGPRPEVDEVALLLRTHTAGNLATGLGADTSSGELTTFTETTRPTAAEADRMITIAYGTVLGEITPVTEDDLPDNQTAQVRHAIALYAAILILISFFKADDAAVQVLRDLYDASIGRIAGTAAGTGRSGRMVSATLASPYSGDDQVTSGLDFASS